MNQITKLEEAIRHLKENPKPIISSREDSLTYRTIELMLEELKTSEKEILTPTNINDYSFVIAFLKTIKEFPSYRLDIEERVRLKRNIASSIISDLFDNTHLCGGTLGKYSALSGDFNKGWNLYNKLKKLSD